MLDARFEAADPICVLVMPAGAAELPLRTPAPTPPPAPGTLGRIYRRGTRSAPLGNYICCVCAHARTMQCTFEGNTGCACIAASVHEPNCTQAMPITLHYPCILGVLPIYLTSLLLYGRPAHLSVLGSHAPLYPHPCLCLTRFCRSLHPACHLWTSHGLRGCQLQLRGGRAA